MSGSQDQANGGGAQQWSRPQHAVAYQEARAVLNAQQQRKGNLDDKALRTARLTTVVVGAVITVAKAFDIVVVEPLGYIGIGLLVVSFGAALTAYGLSGPVLGPSAGGLRELVEAERWERTFLFQLEAAIDVNTTRLGRSSFVLLISDITLFAGVIATLAAIAL
ncbi:hypothetical protein [Halococcus thailandensis]|uniref:Uncharacterized protein n=1 Tax=Halococcus thailandensis JCM 13552 TaxID=1227457 RepID=M0NI04_9EURY|nr:hypothetical protein [Halococcus thailandensis]EMA56295.1 hypothetical protein C451_03104 [Halococcus thailandensis JCM 13552]